jgi:hypothetical protein
MSTAETVYCGQADFAPVFGPFGRVCNNPKGAVMPDSPKSPRSNKTQSLGAVFGLHLVSQSPAGAKRPVLFGRYTIPSLCFGLRMQWLAKVQRLLAQCSQNHEHYPHKVFQVASVLAHIGDECNLSHEGIAERAGCVERTVTACTNWLEERGVLTWTHTARRHESHRVVRSANIYTLIIDFTGLRAIAARFRRAIWRDREKRVSEGKVCPGVTQPLLNTVDRFEARSRLAEASRIMKQRFEEEWWSKPGRIRPRLNPVG